jgi:glucose-specific phosphotransferase system IIBC component
MFLKLFNMLQNIGRSVMIPIALLPAAGILLAFGATLQDPTFVDKFPLFGTPSVIHFLKLMLEAGGVVFANLPILFAVGVAIGLSDGEGVAGLSAIVGFLIMNVVIGNFLDITAATVSHSRDFAMVLGIPSLQTGVFGGIAVGILASILYKRFYNIQLPAALQFFSGKRFVPILTSFCALFLGLIMAIVWPPVQHVLNNSSTFIMDQSPGLAAFIFGFVERLLIPFGLNHVWWPTFWLQFGEYIDKAGHVIHGDQLIFFAQLKDNAPITAGTFMTGMYPLKMFCMPAAALAIYHCARAEQKKMVAGIMLSGAITAFVCGITEPLEFSFLFVAPALYFIHAIFAGLGFLIMYLLNVHIGLSFSGGFIDFVFFGIMPNQGNWWLVIPVGLIMGLIYYITFRFAITKWNLMTPGREEKEDENMELGTSTSSLSEKVLAAFGGKHNIIELNACMSRLRITVKDKNIVNKELIKSLGAAGTTEMGNHIQAVFGMKSDRIKEEIKILMRDGTLANPTKLENEEKLTLVKVETETSLKVFKHFSAPCSGTFMKLEDIPDTVFNSKMMGDGVAIEITGDTIIAPFDGEVITVFPTKHAIALKDKYNHEVLIHIGLDTVKLNGQGFTVLIENGYPVKKGDRLITVDRNLIREKGLSLVTPIIFTNLDKRYRIVADKIGEVVSGEEAILHAENLVD